jgi:8-oxo-dGTP pyrophosphatase MutT (NUDIX family)
MRDENIDILDANGRCLGTKTRAQVHAAGDWHAVAFVWAAWKDEADSVRLFLQVRAHPDDPFAGNIDAPAGGHILAGETPEEGARREFSEEVGIELGADELIHLGHIRREGNLGPCRRVFQHFYLCPRRLSLEHTCFNAEVSGFLEVGLDDLAAVLAGNKTKTFGRARLAHAPDTFTRLELTPASLHSYGDAILDVFRRSFVSIDRYMRQGRVDLSVWE